MYQPRPGDYGLTRIPGVLGWLIRLGQALTGDASRYTHAFVVLPGDLIVEAMPSGARVAPLALRAEDWPLAYSHHDLTPKQRQAICSAALSFVGRGYSFANYVSLALLGLGLKPAWLRRHVADSGRMICSQLVDEAYRLAGVHLFDDGRAPGDVTPGDLAHVGLILNVPLEK
ncbi:MAG: hypothetical protein ACOYY2_13005 [Actinomycetota bacterium]